ncbi:MAG: hypothetical protein JWM80_3685 [Cyanobacteria bacterium RYN_339]|nr:hypothetical protein [Cyanobacteria bacterium RYN_339]
MRFTKLALVSILVLGATGCGKQAVTQVRATTAATSSTGAMSAAPAAAAAAPDASGVAPMAAMADTGASTPAAPAGNLQDITATVASKKNGTLFGMGKFKCSVDVSNPSSVGRSGTLTVTFLNNGNPSKTPAEVRPLALKAGESRSYDFEDARWTTDDVEIEVKTNPVAK